MQTNQLAKILFVSIAAMGFIKVSPVAAQETPVAGAAAFSIDRTGVVRGVAAAAAAGTNAHAQASYAAGESRAQAFFFANTGNSLWDAPVAGESYTEGEAGGTAINIFSLGEGFSAITGGTDLEIIDIDELELPTAQ